MRRVALIETPSGPIDPLRPLLLGNLIGAVWARRSCQRADRRAVGWSALLALGEVQQAAAYSAMRPRSDTRARST
jgi:hypothetical protein